jgi:hypothetical protein
VFVIQGGNVPFCLFPLPEGWRVGPRQIVGDDRFGTEADILLGIIGAFVVRWSRT